MVGYGVFMSDEGAPRVTDETEWFERLGPSFARHARARRLNMRLSQERVADSVRGVFGPKWHQTIVAKIENGQRAVRLDEALAMCRIYGIELDDLLHGRNLDMIRDAYSTADESEGAVYVQSRWGGDPDAKLVPIEDLLRRAERSLKSETTRDALNLAERLKREYPDDKEAQVRAWQAERKVRRGEHQAEE